MSAPDMIPRIVVRDPEDAMLILFALRNYMHSRLEDLTIAAKHPNVDQFALSLMMIEETRAMTDLMDEIGKNVMTGTDPVNSSTTTSKEN